MIEAFSEEFQKEKNIKLLIAGSGKEKKHLGKLIKKYQMNYNIQLVGQLSREKTRDFYRDSECFVLPSRAETFGLVYREALAVGRPIISTKHGGFTYEDWHDEYGLLIDIDDKEQLKKALRYMYKNYKNYKRDIISKLCLNDCSTGVVINQINKVLKESIERR